MIKPSPSVIIPVISICGMALSGYATSIINDTWNDGTRTDPASPTYSENGVDGDLDGNRESAWFTSNAAGNTTSVGHMVQATAAGSTSWQTYFTPTGSPISLTQAGDSLRVRWAFTPSGVANDGVGNTGQNFRLAVVSSPVANRVSTDTAPGVPSGGNYLGYAMFMNFDQTLRRSTPFELRERNAGVGGFLSATADWTAIGNNGTTGNPGYANGTLYTYTLTLTRNGTGGLDIDSKMEGTGLGPGGLGVLEVSLTDATPSSFTYDMFGVRPSAATTSATSFDTTLFAVDFIPAAPEPSSFALAGMGVFGLAWRYRRKHS